jgi:putative hemolysin
VLQTALVFVLILFNALFSLAEYALITVRGSRIRQLVEEGNHNAILVERMKERPTRMQATLQTGLTLVTTFSSALAATGLVAPVTAWLQKYISSANHSVSAAVALVLVTVPVAVLTLVVGEIAPKSVAMRHPEKVALIAVHPISWLEVLLSPLVAILTFLSNVIVRPFGGSASFVPTAADADEYKIIVDAGKESGVLDPVETSMIHQVLDFSDTVVRKVMTPRIDLTTESVTATMSDLVQIVRKSGHSRIPVFEGDLDNIVGVVHAKDLLNLPDDVNRDTIPIRDVMRLPYIIPETKKVGELLAEFRRSKQQMAIVRDEYGITSGLVTIEDLLEQIVGDIQDEYDAEEPMIQVVDNNTTILNGLMGIGEVNDRMGLDLPEDEADTIGGFLFSLLGHQAEQGERVTHDGVRFVVEATDGRRITKVRLLQHERPIHLPSSVPPEADPGSYAESGNDKSEGFRRDVTADSRAAK